ncbi:hypothetical protein EDB89DRAFT_2242130 [Lactarius sanguifluus]|nr:hypothetical protein EDB89DRAFT_2242130 [Lactarius sanguifluus]
MVSDFVAAIQAQCKRYTLTNVFSKCPRENYKISTGLVPAIGSLSALIKANPLLSGLPELDFPPPTALLAPSFPPFTPYVKTFEVGPENLRPGATQDLSSICRSPNKFGGDTVTTTRDPSVNGHAAPSSSFDALRAFKPRQGFRPTSLSTNEPQKRRGFSGTDRTDSLARIWHAARNVLTLLRELEESARDPLSDDAYDAGSDHILQGRVASPTELSDVPTDASFSSGRGGGLVRCRRGDRALDAGAERWEERLVFGSDRLYKQDIEKQRGIIAGRLDTNEERSAQKEKSESESRGKDRRSSVPLLDLDQVVPNTEMAASGRSTRRVHARSRYRARGTANTHGRRRNEDEGDSDDETSGMDDDDLPRWARWSAFPDDPLMRTHAARCVPLRLFMTTSRRRRQCQQRWDNTTTNPGGGKTMQRQRQDTCGDDEDDEGAGRAASTDGTYSIEVKFAFTFTIFSVVTPNLAWIT